MKKIVISILGGIIILSVIGFIFLNLFPNTIEDTLSDDSTIIYEEKTDEGSIVFYNKGNENNLSACFIKKVAIGYKYIYGGGGDLIKPDNVSIINFPAVEDTPFPLYFGVIDSKDISNVKLENSKGETFHTKIIEWNNRKIWYATIDSKSTDTFKLIALSDSNEELKTLEYTP